MPHVYKPTGLYFEDFEIGNVHVSQGRTITETDVINFAGLIGDYNVLHTNEEVAKKGMYKTRIAHGMLGASIMTGMSNLLGIFDGTTIAFMELTIRYKAPLFLGDTIHLELEPTEKRKSSRPGRGIVKFNARLKNQDGVLVTDCDWVIMMATKE